MTVERSGTVVTSNGTRYIHALCKHFAHKVESVWDESHGKIHFAMGVCTLRASDVELFVHCSADTSDDLEEVTECIKDHFERFAFREQLKLVWER